MRAEWTRNVIKIPKKVGLNRVKQAYQWFPTNRVMFHKKGAYKYHVPCADLLDPHTLSLGFCLGVAFFSTVTQRADKRKVQNKNKNKHTNKNTFAGFRERCKKTEKKLTNVSLYVCVYGICRK